MSVVTMCSPHIKALADMQHMDTGTYQGCTRRSRHRENVQWSSFPAVWRHCTRTRPVWCTACAMVQLRPTASFKCANTPTMLNTASKCSPSMITVPRRHTRVCRDASQCQKTTCSGKSPFVRDLHSRRNGGGNRIFVLSEGPSGTFSCAALLSMTFHQDASRSGTKIWNSPWNRLLYWCQ